MDFKEFQLLLPHIRREIKVYELYAAGFQNIKEAVRAHHFYPLAKKQFEMELKSLCDHLRVHLQGHLNHLTATYRDFSKIAVDRIINVDDKTRGELETLLKEVNILINIARGHLDVLKR